MITVGSKLKEKSCSFSKMSEFLVSNCTVDTFDIHDCLSCLG